jgi:hypothetical protein
MKNHFVAYILAFRMMPGTAGLCGYSGINSKKLDIGQGVLDGVEEEEGGRKQLNPLLFEGFLCSLIYH